MFKIKIIGEKRDLLGKELEWSSSGQRYRIVDEGIDHIDYVVLNDSNFPSDMTYTMTKTDLKEDLNRKSLKWVT